MTDADKKARKMGSQKKVRKYDACGQCGRSGPDIQTDLAFVGLPKRGRLRCSACRRGS